MVNIVKKIRKDLQQNVETEFRANYQRFFTEKIFYYGVRTPVVRRLAEKYFKKLQASTSVDKKTIFTLSEELYRHQFHEEAIIATQWLAKLSGQFTKKDFKIFANWLNKYLDNWSKVDDFCLHLFQPLIRKYPELISPIKLWSFSKNRWVRRASAVSLISTQGSSYVSQHQLADIFTIVRTLFNDPEDLVQKAAGWLLKASSIHHQQEIFKFVMKYRTQMSRTTLRYAIEKMPTDLRRQALDRR